MSIMDKIRLRQELGVWPSAATPPEHRPEILYIGCVDARLDPIDDIGIDKGKALIFRNIGALVRRNESATSADSVPPSASIGAVLEFFLNHIPAAPAQVKHIIISGHTDCGGLQACQHNACGEHDHYLPLYLDSLKSVRAKVMAEAKIKGWNDADILHALEKESVRQSVANLLTYPVVQRALDDGLLEIHGWVIDTATQRIAEMNPATLEFEPMAERAQDKNPDVRAGYG